MFDRNALIGKLDSRIYTVTVLEEIESTNTALKEMAQQGARIGTTLIAQRQTGGRGRLGRQFFSPQGGLYMSTLVAVGPQDDPGSITCRAAVAVAQALGCLCGLQADIKWVNDIYLNGRKLAGILAEGVFTPSGRLMSVVLGIGINVGEMEFPPDLTSVATSLANEGYHLTREQVAAAVLIQLYHALTDPTAMEEYRHRNVVLGRSVTVTRGSETYPATAESITDEGHLVVRTTDNEIRTLSSGEVSVKL